MGSMSVPRVVRQELWPMIEDAILDSRSEDTLEISVEAATQLLRRRIFANTEVRIVVLGESDSLAPFIHDLAVPYFFGYQIGHRIEDLKLDLATKFDEEITELHDLKDDCYSQLLSYRVKGRRTAVIKFVGDMALWEIREVARQFNQKKIAAGKRETYASSIVEKLEQAGADEDTTVSAAIAEPVSV